MCLRVLNQKEKIAKEDIICYKILNRTIGDDGNLHLITPFCNKPVTDDMLKGKPFIPDRRTKCQIEHDNLHFDQRGAGWIHVIDDKKIAIKVLRDERAIFESLTKFFKSIKEKFKNKKEILLYECIIPKGTKYISGYSSWGSGYAAKKIIFKREIKIK